MSVTLPSNCVEITDKAKTSIKDYSFRRTGIGPVLLKAFKVGPSAAVLKHGRIFIEEYKINNEPTNNNTEPDDKKDNTGDDQGKKEDRHYSIMNLSRLKFEADDRFSPGDIILVYVVLPGEGYTLWKIQLDKQVNFDKFKDLVMRMNFEEAYNFASKSTESDGLAVLSCRTFVKKDAVAGVPWMGHCNFGFDAGIENDRSEDDALCLAVVPIDMKERAPKERNVFKFTFRVTGDISDGKVSRLLAKFNNAVGKDDTRSWSSGGEKEKNSSDDIHEYIKGSPSKFAMSGNHTKYDDFLKDRNFIADKLKNKQLEFSESESAKLGTVKLSDVVIF